MIVHVEFRSFWFAQFQLIVDIDGKEKESDELKVHERSEQRTFWKLRRSKQNFFSVQSKGPLQRKIGTEFLCVRKGL
jgi:hypothetical protein